MLARHCKGDQSFWAAVFGVTLELSSFGPQFEIVLQAAAIICATVADAAKKLDAVILTGDSIATSGH